MRVGVVSLGCAKNRVDTEEMLSLLSQEGYELTDKAEDAEVLVGQHLRFYYLCQGRIHRRHL